LKGFIAKILIFSILPFLSLFWIVSLENGETDYFYNKISSPRKKSIIFGTSKSEQGIIPSILNGKIEGSDFYNFSFALSISPYGKTYFESIKDKVNYSEPDGIFILTIDPWAVASFKEDEENELIFEETQSFLSTIPSVTINPNIFYLKDFFLKPFFEILLRKFKSGNFVLHDDGWLEVIVSTEPEDRKERVSQRLMEYKKRNENYILSHKRFDYFEKIIIELKNQGKVFIVRLPVEEKFAEYESDYEVQFNYRLNEILVKHKLNYLDFTKGDLEKWSYIDGIHLDRNSAKLITNELSDWILSYH